MNSCAPKSFAYIRMGIAENLECGTGDVTIFCKVCSQLLSEVRKDP